MLVTGFPYDISLRENVAHTFENFLLKSRAVRRDGSAAIDGFWEDGLNPWDVAAGVLMIQEAGGSVTTYGGDSLDIYTPPICASNGTIHGEMLAVLKSAPGTS